MELLLGAPVSKEIKENLIKKTLLKKRKPHLVILLNKEDTSSIGYVRSLNKVGNEVGIELTIKEVYLEEEYIKEINSVNENKNIDACLITRPLPKETNEQKILSLLAVNKDVDSLNPLHLGQILFNNERHVPNTALAIIKMIEYYNIELSGKKVLVIGRSYSVGKPVSLLLMNRNATVTVAHSRTKNLHEELKNYDIIVCAIGKAQFIDSKYMKEGAIVLDAGIHYLEEGIFGDVVINEKLSLISKVPGGIGPITSACLMENVLYLYEENNDDY